MRYDQIILRYGDLTVKGKNRSRFERRMLEQVKRALAGYEGITFHKSFGRLNVKLGIHDYKPIADRLKELFGIVSLSPVVSSGHDLEEIRATALALMNSLSVAPETFKVSAKRAWKKFPHTSQEMNHLVGGHILRHTPELRVDVRNPQQELRVDIQEEGVYLFCETIQAAGGFPYGTNGKALLLLSGGIDSPVAGWLALRKGLELEAVHFHSYPFTSDKAKEKVVELARRLSYFSGEPIKLHLVPFTDIQTALVQAGSDNLIITLMRRSMLRITERLAEQNGAQGIVTGESLGQVASQTLPSMDVIGRAARMPLIKPVIMMDKQEIIKIADRIGTFETSILPYEDCCTLFLPKSPSTNPNLRIVEKVEAMLPNLEAMLAAAVEGTETQLLSSAAPSAVESAGKDSWF